MSNPMTNPEHSEAKASPEDQLVETVARVFDPDFDKRFGHTKFRAEKKAKTAIAIIQQQEREAVLHQLEMGDGKMWSAGRLEFEKWARRYSDATRHEEAMVICDGAGSEVLKATLHAYAKQHGIEL